MEFIDPRAPLHIPVGPVCDAKRLPPAAGVYFVNGEWFRFAGNLRRYVAAIPGSSL